ncbi:MAG TPA: AAA family ATPase [Candidatus Paceibacterota bacterium]|nr:AAA family ATPase [Candidatus Paceibacterota bacterium]
MFNAEYDIFRDPSYRFAPAIRLDAMFPPNIRAWISRVSGAVVLVFLLLSIVPYVLSRLPSFEPIAKQNPIAHQLLERLGVFDPAPLAVPDVVLVPGVLPGSDGVALPLNPASPKGNAVFLVFLAIWLSMKMLQFYWRSYYYHVEGLLERGESGAQTPYTTPNYEVCWIYYRTKHGDLVKSFLESPFGAHIMLRLGFSPETAKEFLAGRTQILDATQHYGDLKKVFTLRDLVAFLVAKDPDFYQFLFERGIRERELVGTTEWVERDLKKRKQQERYWGKVKLGQSTSFGAEWAYGGAYVLGKYGRDLSQQAIGGGSNFRFVYGNDQIHQLEIILARAKEANALLVGEEGTGKMDVILDFARDIMNGYVNPNLKHKRVMAFDTKGLLSSMQTKADFETEMLRVMTDAANAGNIILVIEDLPGLILGAHALESDIMALIDPFLQGKTIQIIATADNTRYHQFIEPNNAIMQRFEKVVLTEPEEEALIRVLEEVAESTERRNPVYFTYPAIVEIIKCAQNYFTDGVMPDKAIDIMVELTPTVLAKGGRLVKKMDVLEFVHEKTKIPIGNIGAEERDKLLHLEDLLQKYVVGQHEALVYVANAMRRSRAGVRNQNRPIGAFLFLGPTGVGKTETAKALATVFFGNENAMARIDMSEYQGDDGLNRMIGTQEGELGTLPVILKEQPYGVLLLDEFEKTNPKVLDLFLQILDEGVFHNAQGKKINARNIIFIATSNAGAQVIREAVRQGVDLSLAKKEIIDRVIDAGKLKPELLNRFDGVVLYHPLTREEYRQIAVLMLEKLKKRLKDKSIDLHVNDVLVEALLARGVDPEFGARPMARAVQEIVEQKVAEKIIAGKLLPGSVLEFSEEDFRDILAAPMAGISNIDTTGAQTVDPMMMQSAPQPQPMPPQYAQPSQQNYAPPMPQPGQWEYQVAQQAPAPQMPITQAEGQYIPPQGPYQSQSSQQYAAGPQQYPTSNGQQPQPMPPQYAPQFNPGAAGQYPQGAPQYYQAPQTPFYSVQNPQQMMYAPPPPQPMPPQNSGVYPDLAGPPAPAYPADPNQSPPPPPQAGA